MDGVGLYIEENLGAIQERFRAAMAAGYGIHRPALQLGAPVLLQDAARHARKSSEGTGEPWRRAALLIASQPEGGLRMLVREFGALRRALWETLAERHHAVPAEERRRIDAFLDETCALAAERWAAGAGRNTALPTTEAAPSLPPPLPISP